MEIWLTNDRMRLLYCFYFLIAVFLQSTSAFKDQCINTQAVSIFGPTRERLVAQGARITLTCCYPKLNSGRDDEQLVWLNARSQPILNYFTSHSFGGAQNSYSLSDYSKDGFLITHLVIANFSKDDVGEYTCKPGSVFGENIKPTQIKLDFRPRLLQDFVPMPPRDVATAEDSIASGHQDVVFMEEKIQSRLYCKKYQGHDFSNTIKITWYFNGRQLVIPHVFNNLEPEIQKRASMDSRALGITFADDDQELIIERPSREHEGLFMCKAESVNPFGSQAFDQAVKREEDPDDSGYVKANFLIQLQPMKVSIYERVVILAGQPKLVRASNNRYQGSTRLSREIDEPLMSQSQDPLIIQAEEGGEMVLECAARGWPPPRILWFRGGHANNLEALLPHLGIQAKAPFTFDSEMKTMIESANSLDEAKRYLGNWLADNGFLLNVVENLDTGAGDAPQELSNRMLAEPEMVDSAKVQDHSRGRFNVQYRISRDTIPATEKAVVAFSRLTIKDVQPIDATLYSCVAISDLKSDGGLRKFAEVESFLPNIVLKPMFLPTYSNMRESRAQGETATIACEAFGGLPFKDGLRLRLIRGIGVIQRDRAWNRRTNADEEEQARRSPGFPAVDQENKQVSYVEDDNRYKIKHFMDRRQPYASRIVLEIEDLRPEDNDFYACEAVTGGNLWKDVYPQASQAPGQLIVYFAPIVQAQKEVFGLQRFKTNLTCEAMGQPLPEWTWKHGNMEIFSGRENYEINNYLNGMKSYSVLTVPEGYWINDVFGEYSCIAQNGNGEDSAVINLEVGTHPGKPYVTLCGGVRGLFCVEKPKEMGGFPLLGYEVRIRNSKHGDFQGPFMYGPESTINLSNLIPSSYMQFAFSAYTKAGRGPNFYLELQKDDRKVEPPMMRLVQNSEPSSDSYNLIWEITNSRESNVNRFSIAVKDLTPGVTEGNNNRQLKTLSSSEIMTQSIPGADGITRFEYKITGLKPLTSYEIKVYPHAPGLHNTKFISITITTADEYGRGGVVQARQTYPVAIGGNDGRRSTVTNLCFNFTLLASFIFCIFLPKLSM